MLSWVIHYEIAAIIIMLAILILFLTGNRIKTKESKLFVGLLFVCIVMAIFDEFTVFANYYYYLVPIWLSYVLNIIYLVALMSIMWMYVLYVIILTRTDYKYKRKGIFILGIPILLEYCLIISAPINHLLFYIDAEGRYHRASGMNQIFVVSAIYGIYIAGLCIRKKRMLTKLQKVAIWFYTGSGVICTVIQMFLPKYLLNAFTFALGLMLIYISLQGNFVDSDRILDTFSGDALDKRFVTSLEQGKVFHLLMIKLGGFDQINMVHGYDASNDALKQISEFLIRLIPKHQVFHMTGLSFICYIEENDSQIMNYVEQIQQKLLNPFYVKDILSDLNVTFSIGVIKCPEMSDNCEQALTILNEFIGESSVSDNKHVYVVSKEVIECSKRRALVETAVADAIRNGSFDVHFQPIIDAYSGKVVSAEALIRLHDEELGDIEPNEFISIAEKNGSICYISNFVVNAVCMNLAMGRLKNKDVDRIHINLSLTECCQPGMAERIISIVNSYNISRDMLMFEITETAANSNNQNVIDNINRMSKEGFCFCLDNFGTGYSNVTELLELPIAIVKVDKNLLWVSDDNEGAKVVLESIIDMINRLGKEVSIEGIETAEQLAMIEELDCDYLQGFYYSKAVNWDMFVEYVVDRNVYGL